MKTNVTRLAGLLLCTILLFTSMACGTGKTLQVGVNEGYRPFGYTANGKPEGFEIELWKEIAKEAGIRYELKSKPSGEILSGLNNGELDVAIAGITIKQNRKKIVDFSTPYLHTGQVLLVRQEDRRIRSVNDLKDMTVATKIGTSGYDYASKIKGVKELKAYPDINEAFDALASKEADAVIYDAPGVFYFVKNEGKGRVKSVGDLLTKEHYSIGLKKGSVHTGRVNNALSTLVENGKFKKLYEKWFDHPPESLPRE